MSVFIITVDEHPAPWEDYSYVYAVVIGDFRKAGEVFNEIEEDHPDWIVNLEEVEHVINGEGGEVYGETFGKCVKCGLNIRNAEKHRKHCLI